MASTPRKPVKRSCVESEALETSAKISDDIRMKHIICVGLIVIFSTVSIAEAEKKKPLTKAQIEKLEGYQKAIDSLEDMKRQVTRDTEKKYSGCMKAIGSPKFCECIKNKTPVGVTFPQYVVLMGLSDEDLAKAKASGEEERGIIENSLEASEKCVGTY